MKTLEAINLASSKQGGTIHQALQYTINYGRVGTSAYRLGLNMGLDTQNPNRLHYNPTITLASSDIPINSFSFPETQVPDYVLGLINAGLI